MAIDWEAYRKKAKKRDEYEYQKNIANNDIAPIRTATTLTGDDIAPPVKTGLSIKDAISIANEYKKKNSVLGNLFSEAFNDDMVSGTATERKWFEKGAFEDGYQVGDITKTILGTVKDARTDATAGALGIIESGIDAGAGFVGGVIGDKDFQTKVEDFIEKDLIDEQAIAKSKYNPLNYVMGQGILTPVIDKIIGEDADDVSVLGDKTDSLVESGGQLVATAGLQAVGVPWWVTSGTTSFGGGMETALNEGATYDEAVASASIQAAAEVLTEKLFGGSGLGEKGLINLEPLTKGISSKLFKTLADYGIDLFAEGAEELLSQIVGNLGTALYKEENLADILFSEEAIDGYIESFIGGSVLGGGMNIGNIASSVKNKTDYRSGLTAQEEKVVEKEIENRIAKEETDGNKLTKKDKAKIREKVLADLDKGYISIDTIESALGGDTYDNYKSVTGQEDALQKEFDTLNKMKQGDMTGEQIDRRTELKEQLKELKNNSKKTELKDKLSNDVFNLAKDSRLAESYNEKARRGKSFEADLSKYDTKQQEVIKKALESGILNNTNRTHEFVDMIAKISADKGVLFDFTNNEKLKNSGFALKGKTVNGYKTDDGNIALNMQSQKALESVVGHEITHILEGTELYSALQESVKQYATTKGEYAERMQSLRELYTGVYKGTDFDTKLQEELTADIVGDYLFSDSDFINSLSTEQPNLFKKIYNEIKYLYKVATAGSKEARELEKVKKAFDNAWKESGTAQKGTQYSIEKDVTVNMSEDERYNILKDKKIQPQEVEIDENVDIDFDYLENNIKSVVETSLWKRFKELNLIKTYKSVIVSDIEFDFTGKGFRKSLHSQENKYGGSKADFAKIALNMQKLLDNAVLIDVHTDKGKGTNKEKRELSQVYVLMSAMREGNKIVPVQFEIQQYANNENRLYLAVALTKIETGVKGNTALENQVATSLLPISDISIRDLFSKINTKDRYFLKYIPNQFLNEEQIEAKTRALAEDRVKYSKRQYSLSDSDTKYIDAVNRGDNATAQMLVNESAEKAGYTDVLYHGTKQFGFTEFDASKSDDKISFFVAGSDDIAQTYSGKYGSKAISSAESVDDLSIEDVVNKLREEAKDDYKDMQNE